MADICLIITCMGRLEHLRQTLGHAAGQPGTACVVVDWSCPDRCGNWVEESYPGVQVVRIPGQTNYHGAGARNHGARAAAAPWLFFVDADILLALGCMQTLRTLLRPGHYYRVEGQDRNLCGTIVCPAAAFAHIGGYDEVMQGWGSEDVDLVVRLRLLGLTEGRIPAGLFRPIAHPEALRVQFYDTKDIQLNAAINAFYVQLKHAAMCLLQQPLPRPDRHQLYERADRLVRAAHQSGQRVQLNMAIPVHQAAFGGDIAATLTLTYSPPQAGP